jgi:hypothetical protein
MTLCIHNVVHSTTSVNEVDVQNISDNLKISCNENKNNFRIKERTLLSIL